MTNYDNDLTCEYNLSFLRPKTSVKIEIALSQGSHNRVKHEGVFHNFSSTKTPLCIVYCFVRKIQAWHASHCVTYLSGQKGNGENCLKMNETIRFKIVPEAQRLFQTE